MISTSTQAPSRHGRASAAALPSQSRNRTVAATTDGEVSVTLHRCASGVLLELEERRSDGSRIIVVTAFTQSNSLDAWCADDPLRFDAPMLHQQVRRHAADLWRNDS
jgi:hypothetical protein